MFVHRVLINAGALVVLAGLPAAQSAPPEWTALTARLLHAVDNGNTADVRAARAAALRVVVTPMAGVSPAVARYTVAYADYRLAADQSSSLPEQRDSADEAEQQLREAIRLDDRLADAYGLLSSVLGMKIAWAASVEAKTSMGPESSASLGRGLSLEPDNPRLLLIQGIALFRRPVEYGGDPQQAEALFRRAVALFDAAPAEKDARWPSWGRFDAHVWLGQALARHGDVAGARAEYTKALALAPASSWVKDVLLPALGKSPVD